MIAIETAEMFENCLKSHAPYGMAGITKDCSIVCEHCMLKEKDSIVSAIKDNVDESWLVVEIFTCDVDSGENFCDNCGKDISTYTEEVS